MTNNVYKTIFIHFPKTGGSSIENYFGSGDGVITTDVTLTNGSRKTITESHHTSSKKYVKNNGNDVWQDFFKFSFVRNPWDWFVSHFHWDIKQYHIALKEGRPIKYRRKFIVEECNSDFKTYVKEGAKRPDWFVFPVMVDYCKGVDFIGKFERLQDDFDIVCEKINAPKKKLQHLKKPDPRPHYSKFYDQRCIDIVYGIMKKDIDFFEYTFESK